jgi:hypothetical protein
MSATSLNIVFSGMIAADPHQGGATWAVLQYVLGLQELGHNVVLIEPIAAKSIRPADSSLSQSMNATYFRQVAADFGLTETAALLLVNSRQTIGLSYDQLQSFAARADVLINVSGMLLEHELIDPIPIKAYLDLDPAFIQLWHTVYGIDMRLEQHTHFVTVGVALGTNSCRIPTCGKEWIHTFQPVVLAHWPRCREIRYDGLTTVGNWRGYGSVEYKREFYGQKVHSLRELVELPRQTKEKLYLALAIHPDETRDLEAISRGGWNLMDPRKVAGTPAAYREFIQHSKAEFGLAKSGYVVSRCGWFSDRSACYLASGHPVIAQDTGFSEHLPVGEGLFAFRSVDDAVRCIDSMNDNYEHHADAARRLAETYFRSDRVLTALLQRLGAIS